MMEIIARKIANYIVKGTDLDYEVIKYGIDAILSTILCFTSALIVCMLLGNIVFGILFIVFLTPIKMQFIGYHCKTMLQCIMTYSICSGSMLLINDYVLLNRIQIPIYIYICIMALIIYYVRLELSKKNIAILFCYAVLGIILYYANYQIYVVVLLALFFEFLLLSLLRLK